MLIWGRKLTPCCREGSQIHIPFAQIRRRGLTIHRRGWCGSRRRLLDRRSIGTSVLIWVFRYAVAKECLPASGEQTRLYLRVKRELHSLMRLIEKWLSKRSKCSTLRPLVQVPWELLVFRNLITLTMGRLHFQGRSFLLSWITVAASHQVFISLFLIQRRWCLRKQILYLFSD